MLVRFSRTQFLRPRLMTATAASLLFATLVISVARAERPAVPHLLPEKTLVLVRVANSRELADAFQQTSMGRLLNDEQIRPLVGNLYTRAADQFGKIQEQVGVSLDDLLKIPQGEMAFAVVPVPDQPPAVALFVEVGDNPAAVRKLLARGQEELEKQNGATTKEKIGQVELTLHSTPGNRSQTIARFERDGMLVITTAPDAAKQILTFWDGAHPKETLTLADNRKYTTIMNRCAGPKDERPHTTGYVDAIELARVLARGNLAAQTGLALFPALGLDGLQAIGGGTHFVSGDFDSITHLHVLLDNQRSGVMKMIALGESDSTPEAWVPRDAASYTTFQWDFAASFTELTRLYDSFQTEGSFAALVKRRASDPLGVELEPAILKALDGRVSFVTWYERPARPNADAKLLGFKLKDAAEFRRTWQQILAKHEAQFETVPFVGQNYYRGKFEGPRGQVIARQNRERADQQIEFQARVPEPCFAIVGDYWLASDSVELLKRCMTSRGDPEKSLAGELDYKLIASKIARQIGGQRLGLLSFNRPEEGLRIIYDMANAESTRKMLATRGERNAFFGELNGALKDHPLPAFSAIARYFAPAGAMLVNEETGLHYTAFQLRRK